MKCFEAPLPDQARESAPVALNLEVLGRGLAAIGDLFVFDVLPFIQCRKPSLLHRRNVNENVLPTAGGLDKSVALGWVEPLDRTFSHPSSPQGSINKKCGQPAPQTGAFRQAGYDGCGKLGSSNNSRIWPKPFDMAAPLGHFRVSRRSGAIRTKRTVSALQ